jgi:UDP-N-acetylmuramate--alanine ligase
MPTYGFSEDADFVARDIRRDGRNWSFVVQRPAPHAALGIRLALPGDHNVRNALAAIAVATDEGLPDEAIVDGIADFAGVGRRFDVYEKRAVGTACVTLVDDYGHHPSEVRCVIDTARQVWPGKRLVMVYQPHRYTRTRDLYDEFTRVLASVDALMLMEVYPAGETPIAGADAQALCQGVRARGAMNPVFVRDVDEAFAVLPGMVNDGDVLLVQGAGNVSRLTRTLLEKSDG